ncbi:MULTISPECIES: GtrA family protein [Bacillaceae]|uniref:Polysaccharide biosynthesis protein GtrA n=1 Tax=Gottfriedia luciferensis TaxID=178774 RepID=A0ABX2ZX92_9BACI|nr:MULTISPECIES: GtrA family protein [Bacillaceae]ODG93806.1 polysaccharide biosynthesis protein GtrA [Gottfriedia luciferensis]PGZ91195.1 GtrA family protein [Bacillus sp. AFS029533]SFC28335.1 Putative flippase GtrA (transmembrane translocase of bactoprenol-linked glucose) [Bacillus sp. UNCCL81]
MNKTFFRFIVVGIANTIVGLSFIYLLLHLFGLSYWISTFIGNSLGACISYILNRNFTFKSEGSVKKSIPMFIIVILTCYFIAFNLGAKIIDYILNLQDFISLNFKNDLAVLISSGLYTVLNYFGQKLLVFKNKNMTKKQLENERM